MKSEIQSFSSIHTLQKSWLKLVHPSCAPAFSLDLSQYWERWIEIPLDFNWFNPRSRQVIMNLNLECGGGHTADLHQGTDLNYSMYFHGIVF